jgi:hypothetical protein
MKRLRKNARKIFSQYQRGEFDLQSKHFETMATTTCQLTKVLGDPSFQEFDDCDTCCNPFETTPAPACNYLSTFDSFCKNPVANHGNRPCAKSYSNFFKAVQKYGCLNFFLAPCATSADCIVDPTQACHYGFCEDTCTNTTTDCDACDYETCAPASSDANNRTVCVDPTTVSAADNVAQRNAGITGFIKQVFCTADPQLGVCFDLQRSLPQIDPSNINCTLFAATGCCGPFFGRTYDDCFTATDPTRVILDQMVQACNNTPNAGLLCPFEILFPCSVNGAAQLGASVMFVIAAIVAAFTTMF